MSILLVVFLTFIGSLRLENIRDLNKLKYSYYDYAKTIFMNEKIDATVSVEFSDFSNKSVEIDGEQVLVRFNVRYSAKNSNLVDQKVEVEFNTIKFDDYMIRVFEPE